MATIDPRVEMHVFGAAQGESIVLKLPTGEWGVVDCYASALDDPQKNPILRFLSERGVTELQFLCLTHPHQDHFRGMSHLLTSLRVRHFWRPPVMSGAQLKWIVKLSHFGATKSGYAELLENANELERIFTLVSQQRKQRNTPLIPKGATIGTQLHPVPVDPDAEFSIWAIAPSGSRCAHYEESLAKCFDADGRLTEKLPCSLHNHISMALLVKHGKTNLILGGDVEEHGWQESLNEFGPVSAHAVKVSHHGSKTGYCDGLWQGHASDGKPIGVVTPYRRHHLPRREGLQHISPHVERIAVPCAAAVFSDALPVPLSPHAPVKSRIALQKELNATADAVFEVGRCSFIFDNQGNCVEEHLEGPAGFLPL